MHNFNSITFNCVVLGVLYIKKMSRKKELDESLKDLNISEFKWTDMNMISHIWNNPDLTDGELIVTNL